MDMSTRYSPAMQDQAILFTRGVPATESIPVGELREAAAAALQNHGATVLQYGPAAGFSPLREWLARAHGVEAGRVAVGNGSLQLLEFLCLAVLQPGDVVFTESPSYDRALTLFRRHRATLVGIPLEADGPDLDVLERELARRPPRLVYLIPDFQNPAGVTCSEAKRRRIAGLAERHGFLLVEDAPYRALRYRGSELPMLSELAPERTVHMSSFSKLAGPGVRVGFMIGEPPLVSRLARAAEDTYISPNLLAQAVVYEWCRRDRLAPQIECLKALYGPRLAACLAALDRYLPEARASRPDGGFFLSLTLPPGLDNAAVREAAARRHLQLADGRAFFPDGGGERFLRLPYCALTPAQIEEGVRRLAQAVRELETLPAAPPRTETRAAVP
jgi:DNA-binding transcriptional MocR family regulator